jgi:hypothetical protein
VFVNWGFQVVVAGYIRSEEKAVRTYNIVSGDFWPAATIVEFKVGVDSTAGGVGINLASGGGGVTQNGVAERRRWVGIGGPQMGRD